MVGSKCTFQFCVKIRFPTFTFLFQFCVKITFTFQLLLKRFELNACHENCPPLPVEYHLHNVTSTDRSIVFKIEICFRVKIVQVVCFYLCTVVTCAMHCTIIIHSCCLYVHCALSFYMYNVQCTQLLPVCTLCTDINCTTDV